MPARARPRIALVAALAVIAIAVAFGFGAGRAASASSSPTTPGTTAEQHRRPSVVMIGDSVTHAAVPSLSRAFREKGWEPDIEAHPGDMFRDRQPVAEDLARRKPDVVIINLGTNDGICLQANAPDSGLIPCRYPDFVASDMTADMQAMLALFPMDRTCVVGVLPTTAPGVTALWRFRELTGGVSGLADWGTESRTHLENLWDPIGHLSERGLDNYATFITDAVGRICGPQLASVSG